MISLHHTAVLTYSLTLSHVVGDTRAHRLCYLCEAAACELKLLPAKPK